MTLSLTTTTCSQCMICYKKRSLLVWLHERNRKREKNKAEVRVRRRYAEIQYKMNILWNLHVDDSSATKQTHVQQANERSLMDHSEWANSDQCLCSGIKWALYNIGSTASFNVNYTMNLKIFPMKQLCHLCTQSLRLATTTQQLASISSIVHECNIA